MTMDVRQGGGAGGDLDHGAVPGECDGAAERGRGGRGGAPMGYTEALRMPPVEPMEHLVTPEDIALGEQAGLKRSQEPRFLQFFAELNAGLILTAAAIVFFKTPNHFAFGGTSGLSVILSSFFPDLPVGAFMWIINIVLVLLGFIFLERRAIMWSVFASFALSGYVSLFEVIYPSNVSPTGDMWLDLCFAVILPALGSAIVFDIGASTGGTDILAMILKRHTTMEIGLCAAAGRYRHRLRAAVRRSTAWRVGLYRVLGLFAKTLVVDKAIENIHLRKVCTVICKEPVKVETFIVKELNRTATLSRGYGAFSGECVTVIMSVLSRREVVKLRRYAREVDPDPASSPSSTARRSSERASAACIDEDWPRAAGGHPGPGARPFGFGCARRPGARLRRLGEEVDGVLRGEHAAAGQHGLVDLVEARVLGERWRRSAGCGSPRRRARRGPRRRYSEKSSPDSVPR